MDDLEGVGFEVEEPDRLLDGVLELVRIKAMQEQLACSADVSLRSGKTLIEDGVGNRESKRAALERLVVLTTSACDELEAKLRETEE